MIATVKTHNTIQSKRRIVIDSASLIELRDKGKLKKTYYVSNLTALKLPGDIPEKTVIKKIDLSEKDTFKAKEIAGKTNLPMEQAEGIVIAQKINAIKYICSIRGIEYPGVIIKKV